MSNVDKAILESGSQLLPRFNADGLITAVVTEYQTNDVLMVAFMNEEALKKTLETGQTHFWSRSRQELWHKGLTSGEFQHVQEVLIDCDQDALVVKVRMEGKSACHTGRRSCFYRRITGDPDASKLELLTD
ncbi:MAG: phosphoribosyl-AMP cyclohydrolase [Pseudomonadota bacterium]